MGFPWASADGPQGRESISWYVGGRDRRGEEREQLNRSIIVAGRYITYMSVHDNSLLLLNHSRNIHGHPRRYLT